MLDKWNERLEKHPGYAGALLFILTFVVFQEALAERFVFDDIPQILDNPFVTNPGLWKKIFLGSVWSFRGASEHDFMYRPLQFAVYWFLYRLGGPDPVLFHFFHLLFYAATVWLVFRLGRELLGNAVAAFAGALLWAMHPSHVEAAAWVSALPDAGSAFFYLLGFLFFLRAENSDDRKLSRHFLAALAFFPALFFKEMALSFPLILLAYWLWIPPPEAWRRRLLRWSPYAVAVAAYLGIRIAVLGSFSATSSSWKIPPRVAGAGVGLLGQHAKIFLWPVHLTAFRSFDFGASLRSPWPWLTLLGLLAACWFRKRERMFTFLVVWWVVTLAPCLDFRQVSFPVADRFSFLPTVGPCLALAYAGFVWLPRRMPRVSFARVVLPATTLLVILWAAQDVRLIPHWQDNVALWDYSVQAAPNTALVHLFQAEALLSRNSDLEGAAREYETALRLNRASDRPLVGVTYDCYLGLGRIANTRNQVEEAKSFYDRALATAPAHSPAYKALGQLYFPRGDYARSAQYFAQAVKFNPQDLECRFFLGTCWMKLGKYREAAGQFRAAREVDPTYTQAYEAEARALDAAGDPTGAADARRLAMEHQPIE